MEHRTSVTPHPEGSPSISQLIATEFDFKTKVEYKLKPVLDAIKERRKLSRLLLDEYYVEGEQVTLHCSAIADGRNSPQESVFSVPVSIIDAGSDDTLRAFMATLAESALNN